MKKYLLSILLTASLIGTGVGFAQSASRNLGTDPDATAANQIAASCNLYRNAALVTNTPVVTATGTVACRFPGIVLSANESYTASYVSAIGLEGPVSSPFATGGVPGKPGVVKIVP